MRVYNKINQQNEVNITLITKRVSITFLLLYTTQWEILLSIMIMMVFLLYNAVSPSCDDVVGIESELW